MNSNQCSDSSPKTDLSVFEKRNNNSNLKLSNIEDAKDTIIQGFGGVMGKIKGYMKITNNDEESHLNENNNNESKNEVNNVSLINRISNTILNAIEVEKSYKYFLVLLIIGISITFFSLFFLPMVIISPTKFVSLFSLGSIIILTSFIFVYGTKEYILMLFSKERYFYSLIFITSLIVGVYFAIINPYFIICLVCAIIQFVTLIIFTLSFIPGGGMGISFLTNLILSPFKKLFNRS